MNTTGGIITIGLSPAWDVSCRGQGLAWGRHLELDEQVLRPAGKALNVSRALAWMRCESTACGLWGRDDHEAMRRSVEALETFLRISMTAVDGGTRRNITIIDTKEQREMHLRCRSGLATVATLRRLNGDLGRTVCPDDTCVFAGAMPAGDLLDPVVALVRTCRRQGGRIVADTHGPVLQRLVEAGLPWMIAPNVEELGELLGAAVPNTPARLVAAAHRLLEQVPTILISRGNKGAIVVTEKSAWMGHAMGRGKVLETVGCGDYLLAGFLLGCHQGKSPQAALATALQAATARAWRLIETHTWAQARRQIDVAVERI